MFLGPIFPHRSQTGVWAESWEPHRREADESRAHLQSLASGKSGLFLRSLGGGKRHIPALAVSYTPQMKSLLSPPYWSLEQFLLGDGLSSAPQILILTPVWSPLQH